jgi:hypothetical protein
MADPGFNWKVMVSLRREALASSIAARSVHWPEAAAHRRSPGRASWSSSVLTTLKFAACAAEATRQAAKNPKKS